MRASFWDSRYNRLQEPDLRDSASLNANQPPTGYDNSLHSANIDTGCLDFQLSREIRTAARQFSLSHSANTLRLKLFALNGLEGNCYLKNEESPQNSSSRKIKKSNLKSIEVLIGWINSQVKLFAILDRCKVSRQFSVIESVCSALRRAPTEPHTAETDFRAKEKRQGKHTISLINVNLLRNQS